MDSATLVREKIDAGEEFIRQFNDFRKIDAAFWLKETDLDEWYLYLVSSEITNENIDVAYGEVLQLLKPNQNPWLDPFRVKLLNENKELAQRVLEIRQRYAPTIATNYNGTSIAGIPIEGCFIYQQIPEPSSAP